MQNNMRVGHTMAIFALDRPTSLSYDDLTQPARIRAVNGEELLPGEATHFIVIQQGRFTVNCGDVVYEMSEHQFAALPGEWRFRGEGQALVVSSIGYVGTPLVGGPVEERGRLRYIDGCTSSLLISPPVRGEPCLNLLCLPKQTKQTMHTHPSLRVGLILSGTGACETSDGLLEFKAGTAFVIPPGVEHSFQSSADDMRIVIYHPDSDSGPTHTDHTMLNRTFVEGKSAQSSAALHTYEVTA